MSKWQKNKNLKMLEKSFPGITEIIEKKEAELLEKEAVEVEEEIAFTGERILVAKKVVPGRAA